MPRSGRSRIRATSRTSTALPDTIGSRQANILLADLRAQVVVDQLQTDGVEPKRVKQRGHGPVQFALTAQESRRVEISFSRH